MSVLSPTRSGVLATAAAAGALSALPAGTAEADEDNAIRPFSISFPEDALFDLGRRIAATRWPERETVTDDSQGVQRATIQQLAHYWTTDYDWRKVEARHNLPQEAPQAFAQAVIDVATKN